MSDENCFYKNGLSFECQRCSDCCRLSPGVVYLSKNDLTRLSEWFKISQVDFIKNYCRWVQYYGNKEALALLEKKNYDCVLWDQGGCQAYGARPVQCSTYPFWSWILQSEQSWNEEGASCKGINSGRLRSRQEIDEQKFLYEHNLPITRDLESDN
ncbi:MAG: YkgJ family cysteine cluster protein [Treponema sp.]|nr:YkgJ family cysteine cluster protein [Treponema sp.]